MSFTPFKDLNKRTNGALAYGASLLAVVLLLGEAKDFVNLLIPNSTHRIILALVLLSFVVWRFNKKWS